MFKGINKLEILGFSCLVCLITVILFFGISVELDKIKASKVILEGCHDI